MSQPVTVRVVRKVAARVSVTRVVGPPGPAGPSGSESDATTLLQTHVQDPTPHPTYDDTPSLRLIFENGLV